MSTRLRHLGTLVVLAALTVFGLSVAHAATDTGLMEVDGFPNLVRKPVTFWSDGTRLAGDVFYPKGIGEEEKLPVIVLCHGWGGIKAHLNRGIAPRFAQAGYLVLAFDYRGWGESDSRLVLEGEMPEPDDDGFVTVKVRAIKEVVDPLDQEEDIDAALTFVEGEPHADVERIGIWGSSFGATHVIWRAAHDERVKAVVSQVGGYGRSDEPEAVAQAKAMHAMKIQRVRGELEPVPQTKPPFIPEELRGTPYLERMAEFFPGDFVDDIDVPVQILQAENEHYFKPDEAAKFVYDALVARGVPAEYHLMKGIGHYDIYRGEPLDEAMKLETAFFDKYLKGEAE